MHLRLPLNLLCVYKTISIILHVAEIEKFLFEYNYYNNIEFLLHILNNFEWISPISMGIPAKQNKLEI